MKKLSCSDSEIMLLSHEHKKLEDHLKNVRKIGLSILDRKSIDFRLFSKEDIVRTTELCLVLHDIGKSTKYFQEYMLDIQEKRPERRYDRSNKKSHALLSGILAFSATKKILGNDNLAFISYLVVSTHHGNLDDLSRYFSKFNNNNKDLLKLQLESIHRKEANRLLRNIGVDFDILNYSTECLEKDIYYITRVRRKFKEHARSTEAFFLVDFIFSILIFSDKLEALYHTNKDDFKLFLERNVINRPIIKSELVEKYKRRFEGKSSKINLLREKIYKEVLLAIQKHNLNRKILSINLPTGSGKTLIALKCAIELKNRLIEELCMNPKIIYVLPFTSIIDQNYKVFSEVLETYDSNILLRHHYLSRRVYRYEKYHEQVGECSNEAAGYLIESWESEIIVSTFVQLLHSIFTTENSHLIKFHNIANSIIILDEVQSIPFKYWKLVNKTFSLMAKCLNCYFILMTATMPLIFSQQSGEIDELAVNKRHYFEAFNRIRINASLLKTPMNIEEFKKYIEEEIRTYYDRDFLIVLNTIKSSIEIYEYIRGQFSNEAEIFYLSTNIIPLERMRRIRKIKNCAKRKIIVSTQLVEAGVDIDIHRVYRDLGPMDCINQTAGRCNREGCGKQIGEVVLFRLVDADNRDKEYSSYVYDSILVECTRKTLEGHELIEERETADLSTKYFKELEKYACDDDSKYLLDLIKELKYNQAFGFNDDKEKDRKTFRLIKKDMDTADVFIEADYKAELIWRIYQKYKTIENPFERKRSLRKLRGVFSQYVISVPEKALKKHMDVNETDITRVTNNMLDNIYNHETGFIRKIDADYVF